MANLIPASNVSAGAVASFITVLILHTCAANGIVIPPDVADALPGLFAVVVAHVWDIYTGGNQKHPPAPAIIPPAAANEK